MPWLEIIKPILDSDAVNASVAVVILIIVLMFLAWIDERRDQRFVEILKGISTNIGAQTDNTAKHTTAISVSTEVLRSLVDDIKDIKDEILPVKVRRRKPN